MAEGTRDWALVKREIRSIWMTLTDEDLEAALGIDGVVEIIRQRTGEGADLVREKLDWFVEGWLEPGDIVAA